MGKASAQHPEAGQPGSAAPLTDPPPFDSRLPDAALLEVLFDGLSEGVAVLDPELRFVRVNHAFAAMNGLSVDAHLGRTPMDLVPEVPPEAYLPLFQRALAGESVSGVEITGSTPGRREGTWVESFRPICSGNDVVGVLVAAADVTDVRRSQIEAERSATRLRHLQGIVEAGLGARRVDDLLEEVAARARAMLDADSATLLLLEPGTRVLRVRAASGLPDEARAGVRVPIGEGVAGGVAATGRPRIIDDLSTVTVVSRYLREHGLISLVAAPLMTDGTTFGVLHVGSRRPAAFGEEELSLLTAAATRAALAIDRATADEVQRSVAETLQRSLLPGRLPELPEVQLTARYQPSGAGLSVGGDWYDALPLPDGRLALVIGDVVGHGVQSAAVMGRLRATLRAHLTDGHGPNAALRRLDDVVSGVGPEAIATAVVGVLDPADGTLTLAVAGHPPPLLRSPDGGVTVLDQHHGPVLGLGSTHWPEQTVRLAPGGLLALYTDGLVERRGADVTDGVRRAGEALADCQDLETCADRLLTTAGPLDAATASDDVAVLIAARPADHLDKLALRTDTGAADFAWLRRQVREWLRQAGAEEDETDEVVLAVGEALARVAGNDLASPVELSLRQAGNRVQAVVRSRSGDAAAGAISDDDRGRALVVMGALTDLLVLDTQHGLELQLSRRLGGARPS